MQEQKEQIGRNSQKFVRNSYEFRTNFTSRENSHKLIHVKFVRNLYQIHVNFVQFANTQSKHTSKHTLQSHGQVMLHAPVLAHLGDRHAGTVFTRCHSVVGRPGGQCRTRRSGSPTPRRHRPPWRPPAGARCPRRTACTGSRPR